VIDLIWQVTLRIYLCYGFPIKIYTRPLGHFNLTFVANIIRVIAGVTYSDDAFSPACYSFENKYHIVAHNSPLLTFVYFAYL